MRSWFKWLTVAGSMLAACAVISSSGGMRAAIRANHRSQRVLQREEDVRRRARIRDAQVLIRTDRLG